jgi:hypothetical protein
VLLRPTADDPTGLFDAHKYATLGCVGALTLVVAMLASAAGLHHRVPWLVAREQHVRLATLVEAVRSRAFLSLFTYALISAINAGVGLTLGIYVFVFYFHLTAA